MRPVLRVVVDGKETVLGNYGGADTDTFYVPLTLVLTRILAF